MPAWGLNADGTRDLVGDIVYDAVTGSPAVHYVLVDTETGKQLGEDET